jgi:murein DD-endopeptidase MepM/ murein hydrolase activator NlpD
MPTLSRPLFRALALGALALVASAAPAAAQRARTRLLGEVLGPPKFEYLSRIGKLSMPVQGVQPERLRDSYEEGRSEGRVHQAIDIHAPKGTPVVAVADGVLLKLHKGSRGGNSIYHLDQDGRTRYYYAHLEGYAEGLREGQRVKQGEVIGYVGDTGNAAPGDFHLHFSVVLLRDAKRWWEGVSLNPYNLLAGR